MRIRISSIAAAIAAAFLALQASPAGAREYTDSIRVMGSNIHVQGIAYDDATGCFFCSFTTAFYKIDREGRILATIDGIHGHLGAMCFDPGTRKVYASLECKDDEIGRGVSKALGVKGYTREETRFYIAEIDVDAMTMQTHEVAEVRKDYLSGDYGCGGMDGVAIAPAFGKAPQERGDDDGKYLYLAYGVYGDTTRTDNNHNILLRYSLDDLSTPDRKYFIPTGNTTYGVQNLMYDSYTDRLYMLVYRGRKRQYPNYGIFALDMEQDPVSLPSLPGVPYHKGGCLYLNSFLGWYPSVGSTGICSLGDGRYYVGMSGKQDGKQFCDFKIYRYAAHGDCPFVRGGEPDVSWRAVPARFKKARNGRVKLLKVSK